MMLRLWLILALVLCTTACFRDHGLGGDGSADAGAADVGSFDGAIDSASDGGACFDRAGEIDALVCPSSAPPGSTVRIGFTNVHPGCCSDGESRVRVGRRGNTWTLNGEWTVCDCCDACRCLGPIREGSIEIGPLEPGVHRVVGDGSECTIVVEEDGAMCRPLVPSSIRAQRVLFDGQQLGFSMVQEDTSCGCQPRLSRAPEDAFVAELCNCCDDCFCIDAPYAVSYLGDPVDAPPTTVNGVALPTEHRAIDSCFRVEPTGLRVEAPESPVTRDGPAIWWAVVSGVQDVCCVEPFGGVNELIVGAIGRHLELRSCVDFDCDCVGRPQPFEAWYPLGEYAPGGGDLVRAGSFEVSFTAD